jgi:hypothetical protein
MFASPTPVSPLNGVSASRHHQRDVPERTAQRSPPAMSEKWPAAEVGRVNNSFWLSTFMAIGLDERSISQRISVSPTTTEDNLQIGLC